MLKIVKQTPNLCENMCADLAKCGNKQIPKHLGTNNSESLGNQGDCVVKHSKMKDMRAENNPAKLINGTNQRTLAIISRQLKNQRAP